VATWMVKARCLAACEGLSFLDTMHGPYEAATPDAAEQLCEAEFSAAGKGESCYYVAIRQTTGTRSETVVVRNVDKLNKIEKQLRAAEELIERALAGLADLEAADHEGTEERTPIQPQPH